MHPYVTTNNLMVDASNKWYENMALDPKVVIISYNYRDQKNAWQCFPQPFNNVTANEKHSDTAWQPRPTVVPHYFWR